MKQNKEVKISYWAAHITTIISVTLVLILIGLIGIITIGAASQTRKIKQQIELSMIMADSVGNAQAADLLKRVATQPYTRSARLITKEGALKAWTRDTGEDLEKLFGVNPLSPEIVVNIKADYASESALKKVTAELSKCPGVESVAAPDAAIVESMNRNIETISLTLGGIALIMVIISFVLISNTVKLTIYSRRFTIHTMQLVGATNGFIRRPFVLNNMLTGLISCLLAVAVLALAVWGARESGTIDLLADTPWWWFAIVAGALLVIACFMCGITASVATSKYLRKDYDDLFR